MDVRVGVESIQDAQGVSILLEQIPAGAVDGVAEVRPREEVAVESLGEVGREVVREPGLGADHSAIIAAGLVVEEEPGERRDGARVDLRSGRR